MPFDFNKYRQAEFQPRTEDVPVSGLTDFFAEGEPAVWKVRGLSAIELAKVREAVERNGAALKNLVAALTYAAGDVSGDLIREIRDKKEDMVPGDVVRRYELLMAGSLAPEVKEKSEAILLARHHPGEFYEITNKILELTGLGALPGKPTPCGGTPASGPV